MKLKLERKHFLPTPKSCQMICVLVLFKGTPQHIFNWRSNGFIKGVTCLTNRLPQKFFMICRVRVGLKDLSHTVIAFSLFSSQWTGWKLSREGYGRGKRSRITRVMTSNTFFLPFKRAAYFLCVTVSVRADTWWPLAATTVTCAARNAQIGQRPKIWMYEVTTVIWVCGTICGQKRELQKDKALVMN